MPLVGTAGHVDHGKSTLIQYITGRNPDRWAEERERGLTIDLGFAWATLPGGTEVSFVDVPGHERYLKNMLAGIEAIDVVMFVVAADEGWMPQSEEHLAVLDLLGVDRGVVAVTKADAVETDLLELAMAETIEHLEGSSLADARVMAVSGVTGRGVHNLLEALESELPAPAEAGDRPRLWVDRSFAVSGAGTVVTGSLLGGPLSIDQRVVILPGGRSARIRGIQSHEKAHDIVGPGRRVALNLGGVDHDDLARGDMIGLDGQWETSSRFVVSLSPARFVDALPERGAYQLHVGSSAHRVEIRGLDHDIAVFRTDTAIPMAVGDRFIVRDTGRKLVVGGGRILDPAPGKTGRALQVARRIDPDATPDVIADELLAVRGRDSLSRLAAHSGGGTPTQALIVGDEAVTREAMGELTARSVALVREEHRKHPLRPGLPLATLAERLGVSPPTAEAIVDSSDELVRAGPHVGHVGHEVGMTAAQEDGWRNARARLAEDLSVPAESQLGLAADVIGMQIRKGELVRISPDLVYLPEQIEKIRALLSTLGDEFTVADFRDHAGLSRKYAVPILEWCDKEGLTVRRGDLRRLR